MLRIPYVLFTAFITIPYKLLLLAILMINNRKHKKSIDAVTERQRKWEAYKVSHNIVDLT